ncbi:hypothetical protein B0H14DRAFT_2744351, partial [Mycena olivaceomarginata]
MPQMQNTPKNPNSGKLRAQDSTLNYPYLAFTMLPIPSHETRRLFGTSSRPEFNTNVRHRAILRKALELYTPEQLGEVFHQNPTRLRVAMGSASTFSQLGKIKTNFGHDYAIRNAAAKPALQAGEQTWHNWIGPIVQLAACLVVRTGLCRHFLAFRG